MRINKKAHPIDQMSFEYFVEHISKLESDLSVPSIYCRDGIGTFPHQTQMIDFFYHPESVEGGCQGFIGPLPSAFLDKYN